MSKPLPEDLQYTEHDEWVRTEDGETLLVVGITDFAQDALGEIVHVELPEVGAEVEKGDPAGEIESVKTVAELYAPVSGEIVAVNDALDDEPEVINDDPYGNWIFKVKIADSSELAGLLDAAAYQSKIDASGA